MGGDLIPLLPAIIDPRYPHPIMHPLKHITGSCRWLACSSLLLLAQIAVAAPAAIAPPQPTMNKNAPAAWIGMLLMVVIVGVILAISLMPSRRGHQD